MNFRENQTIIARLSGAAWRVHYVEPEHYVVQRVGSVNVERFSHAFTHENFREAFPHER